MSSASSTSSPGTQDLWPSDFGESPLMTPVAILRTQGNLLGEKTSNIVVGRVSTFASSSDPHGFRHILYLFCAPLAYQAELVTVDHGIELYPVTIHATGSKDEIVASDPETFA